MKWSSRNKAVISVWISHHPGGMERGLWRHSGFLHGVRALRYPLWLSNHCWVWENESCLSLAHHVLIRVTNWQGRREQERELSLMRISQYDRTTRVLRGKMSILLLSEHSRMTNTVGAPRTFRQSWQHFSPQERPMQALVKYLHWMVNIWRRHLKDQKWEMIRFASLKISVSAFLLH